MRFIVCTLLGTLAFGQLQAQNIVVGWGGESAPSTVPLNGWASQVVFANDGTYNANPSSRTGRLGAANVDAISTDAIVGRPFSESIQFSPTSGYTGQKFYGGAMANIITPGVTVPTIDDLQIRSGGVDYLDFRFQLSSKLHDSRIAIFFDKADFLAGGNTPGNYVQFGANSSLSMKVGNSSSQQAQNDGELRWIVREGGQWWISAANANGDPNIKSKDGGNNTNPIQNGNTLTSTVANGELRYWAQYNPASGGGLVNMNFEPAYTSRFVITNPASVFNRDLNTNPFLNIDAIGFYIEGDQFASNVFQFELESITFNMAITVPEPGTFVMIGLMGVGYISLRNQRRKATPSADEAEKANQVNEQAESAPVLPTLPA